MDWSLCVICQCKTREPLHCPASSKRKDVGAGYSSFVKNLEEFKMLGAIPTISTGLLSYKGQSVQTYLLQNNASWHKTCREMFSNTKLERAKRGRL